MIMVFFHDALFTDQLKIDENRPKFFVCVIAGSIGFQWIAVQAIGLVRKEAVDDSTFFGYFFTLLSLASWIPF